MKPSDWPIGTIGIFIFEDMEYRLWTIQAIYEDGGILISGPFKKMRIINGELLRYSHHDEISGAKVFKLMDDFDIGI